MHNIIALTSAVLLCLSVHADAVPDLSVHVDAEFKVLPTDGTVLDIHVI